MTALGMVFLSAFYLLSPALILYLCHKFPLINKLGSVLVAYIFGLLLGSSGLIPEGSDNLQDIIMSASIPLAIPLLLFSSNVKDWFSIAGKSFLSMLLAVISVIVTVVVGFLIFKDTYPELWKVGGMLVGVYTGGTPNLASLKLMLDVNENTYLVTHTYDMALSGLYFFFLLIAGQKVFSFVLPRYKPLEKPKLTEQNPNTVDPYQDILQKKHRKGLAIALALAVLIVVISGAVGLLVPSNIMMVTVILLITSLAMGFSFFPFVRNIEKSFDLGMYLILIFSVTVASMVNVHDLLQASPQLFYYISFVVFGSLLLHVLLSAVFKIDTDTVIVTSTALICSPPFVPAVAGAMKNKEVILPGLTIGIIGYAIGNYLGFILANFLHNF